MTWQTDAACRDLDIDLFFDPAMQAHGIAVCHGCPVADECLADGRHDHYGVRGGLYPHERRRLRDQQRRGPA